MKRLVTTIHLDPDIKAWLNAEAAKRRCSLSQIIREMILEKMDR